MKSVTSVFEEPVKALPWTTGQIPIKGQLSILKCLPDSDPSEGLALTLSGEESPLSGFRLKPAKRFLGVLARNFLLHHKCTTIV